MKLCNIIYKCISAFPQCWSWPSLLNIVRFETNQSIVSTEAPLQRSTRHGTLTPHLEDCDKWRPWFLRKVATPTRASNVLSCYLANIFCHQASKSPPQREHCSVSLGDGVVIWDVLWGNDGLKYSCNSIKTQIWGSQPQAFRQVSLCIGICWTLTLPTHRQNIEHVVL